MDGNVELANVLSAITHTMPCNKCPYPCKLKEKSSQANCDRNWLNILIALGVDIRQEEFMVSL